MRKKYDKIDLKSDAFKIKKTPQKHGAQTSRSPTAKSPGFMTSPSPQIIDPNQLFQKVCCPNCKYLFKIIKNNELLSQSIQKKKQQKKNASAQTQQQFNMPDLKAMMMKMSSQLNEKLPSKLSQSAIFKTRLIKQNLSKNNEEGQTDRQLISQTYQFQQRSPFKKSREQQRSTNSAKEESQLPKSLSLLGNKTPDQTRNQMFNQEARLYRKQQIETIFKKQLKYQLSDELQQLLVKNLKNQNVLEYISQFYSQLPSCVQKPGYAKMLLRESESTDQLIYFS